MKVIAAAALVLVLCAVFAHAVVPHTISYQGALRDGEGDIVPDDIYSIEFNIYDVVSGGTALWTETQSVEVLDGIFSVTLGELVYLGLAFDVPYWLGIEVESEGELAPRTELTAAPYAFRAAIADSVRPTAIIDDGDWEAWGGDVWHDGNVGVGPGADNPSHAFEARGDAYFYDDLYVVGASVLDRTFMYDYSAIYNADFEVQGGNLIVGPGEIQAQWLRPNGFFHITDSVNPFLAVDAGNARVGIMTATPGYVLDVNGTVNCTGLRMPTGASDGDVLTSDASGNGTWQPASAASLESGKFNSGANYDLLVDCNSAQLLQNGDEDEFRIHSDADDSSVAYAYYLNGTQVSRGKLSSGANYDFTIPFTGAPNHAEVILSRPWAGGAIARIDIYYDNGRSGGVWYSSH